MKTKMQPPSDLLPNLPEHNHPSGVSTFGSSEAIQSEDIAKLQIQADHYASQLKYGDYLESKVQPEAGRVHRALGRLAGKIITDQEHDYLQKHRGERHNISHSHKHYQSQLEGYREGLDFLLSGTRYKLNNLNEEEKAIFDDYIQTAMPDSLAQVIEMDMKKKRIITPMPARQWMAEEATDDQLTNFLQWHTHMIDVQQTNPEAQKKFEATREEYKKDVAKGIEGGWLHTDAELAIQKVDAVRVVVGDVFDTIMQERGGYHIRQSDHVVVALGKGETEAEQSVALQINADHALKHEFNHAALGQYENHRWLDEALTEHIAEVFKDGSVEIIDPNKRPNQGTYADERLLLDALVNYGDKKIPIELFTLCYSADDEQESGYEAFMNLRNALEEAWGSPFVMAEIGAAIEIYEREAEKDGLHGMAMHSEAVRRVRSDLLQQPDEVLRYRRHLKNVNDGVIS
jgi:hypothetical protein